MQNVARDGFVDSNLLLGPNSHCYLVCGVWIAIWVTLHQPCRTLRIGHVENQSQHLRL